MPAVGAREKKSFQRAKVLVTSEYYVPLSGICSVCPKTTFQRHSLRFGNSTKSFPAKARWGDQKWLRNMNFISFKFHTQICVAEGRKPGALGCQSPNRPFRRRAVLPGHPPGNPPRKVPHGKDPDFTPGAGGLS